MKAITSINANDYIAMTELKNEQMFNDVVKVFERLGYAKLIKYGNEVYFETVYIFLNPHEGIDSVKYQSAINYHCTGTQLTYNQVIVFGETLGANNDY